MIALVFGTRPEAIKVAPVAVALRARGTPFLTFCSGQHTDLLRGTPADSAFGGAISLGLASDDRPLTWTKRAREAFSKVLLERRPSVVAVQGDTMTALAAAEAAYDLTIPVAHIEAGVRSGALRDPWPEERYRRRISQLATSHYAPTATAVANLHAERVRGTVVLTGNTSVDALALFASGDALAVREGAIVVTLHRRELRDRADVRFLLARLVGAFAELPDVRGVWPLHPAMTVLVPDDVPPNLLLGPPLPYATMVATLAAARALVTDSGGLTEEAATLGVPTAVVRDHSDRPEAEAVGVARRFDRADIAEAVRWAAAQPRRPPSAVYGDGRAAQRIAMDLRRFA